MQHQWIGLKEKTHSRLEVGRKNGRSPAMNRFILNNAAGIVLALTSWMPVTRADTITWNVTTGGVWDTTTPNWTADPGGRNDNLYADGDTVIFNDTGVGGEISLSTSVAPASIIVSNTSGAYVFLGSSITAGTLQKAGAGILALSNAPNSFSSITLADGELRWSDTGRLGGGPINVTGNATLRSTKTTSPAYMTNSVINVADGVTLNVYQHNPNNIVTSLPTLAPISGGSMGNPITVNLYHAVSLGRVRLSPSSFVGSFYSRSRILYEGLSDNHFGDSNNVLYIVGGLETDGSVSLNRPVMILGSYPYLGGSPLIFNGPTTNEAIAAGVVFTVRFNNSDSSVRTLRPQGGTVEFGFLPASGSAGPDSGGSGGVTIRFLGDLVGDASFPITKNYDFVGPLNSSSWLYLDAPSSNADVTLLSPVRGHLAYRGGFRKEGAGTLTLANTANNNFGPLQVRGGRLNVTGTLNGVSNVTVQTGATLGGTGTLNLGATNTLTLDNGSTLSPGVGTDAGTLTVNNGTVTFNGTVTYDWDFDETTNDVLNSAHLDFSALTAGTFKIRIAPGTTRKLAAQSRLPLFTYTGTITGFDPDAWVVTMQQESNLYRLAAPHLGHDSDSKTIYLEGLTSTPPGTVIVVR